MCKKIGARMKKILLAILLLNQLYSHDYWLHPQKFRLSKGDTLIVHLFVGDKLNKEIEREFQKNMTKKFELITDETKFNLIDGLKDGTIPVLNRKVDFEGLGLILMERDFAYIELKPEEFQEYLEHENLDEIKEIWKKMGKREVEKERYSRFLKSLIVSGSNFKGDIYKKVFGQKLEIILLQNPFELSVGDSMEAKILFEGKPLPYKTVMVYNQSSKDGKFTEQRIKTDKNGIVKFKLNSDGFWLIRLVHLLPCDKCKDVNWESFWASFSFEIRR